MFTQQTKPNGKPAHKMARLKLSEDWAWRGNSRVRTCVENIKYMWGLNGEIQAGTDRIRPEHQPHHSTTTKLCWNPLSNVCIILLTINQPTHRQEWKRQQTTTLWCRYKQRNINVLINHFVHMRITDHQLNTHPSTDVPVVIEMQSPSALGHCSELGQHMYGKVPRGTRLEGM